jgi:hypothetical protein
MTDVMASDDRPIIVEDMLSRGKLALLADTRDTLNAMSCQRVPFDSSDVQFHVERDWNAQERNLNLENAEGNTPLDVRVTLAGGGDYRLSKDGLLGAIKPFGMGGSYALRCPSHLLEDALNWWYHNHLDRELQLLVSGTESLAQAVTRPTVVPFRDIDLVDRVKDVVEDRYPGANLYVDLTKFHQTVRQTYLHMILPAEERHMGGSGAATDNWWGGVRIQNSGTAEKQLQVSGCFFQPICTNGMIDVGPTSAVWSRRGTGGEEVESALDWVTVVVDSVLGGLEHTLDHVGELREVALNGAVNDTVHDIFARYRLPNRALSRVIDTLVDDDRMTMYSILTAVTRAANDAERADEQQDLMRVGGDLTQRHERCNACSRML